MYLIDGKFWNRIHEDEALSFVFFPLKIIQSDTYQRNRNIMIMPRLKYPLQTTSDGYQSSLEPLSYETDRLYRMPNNNQKTQKVIAKPQIRLNDKKNNKNCRQVVELSQCFKPQIIYSLDIQYCQIKRELCTLGVYFFISWRI